MNKENECEIIKDLAIPFMKKEVNSETKNFIENHLKSCDDCRKYYNDIEKEKGISSKNKDIINKFNFINIVNRNCIIYFLYKKSESSKFI